jgi:hypothetical protein
MDSAVNEFALLHALFAFGLILSSAIYFLSWFLVGERQINRLSVAYFGALLRKDMKWLDMRPHHDFANSVIE